jgi:hypothetical protein
MDNEFEYYLGKCMKNWAAAHALPDDARERLLEKARRNSDEIRTHGKSRFQQIFATLWTYEAINVPHNYRADWYIPETRRNNLDWSIATGVRPHQWFMQLAVNPYQVS